MFSLSIFVAYAWLKAVWSVLAYFTFDIYSSIQFTGCSTPLQKELLHLDLFLHIWLNSKILCVERIITAKFIKKTEHHFCVNHHFTKLNEKWGNKWVILVIKVLKVSLKKKKKKIWWLWVVANEYSQHGMCTVIYGQL